MVVHVSIYVKCRISRRLHEVLRLIATQRDTSLERMAGELLEDAIRKEYPKLLEQVEKLR